MIWFVRAEKIFQAACSVSGQGSLKALFRGAVVGVGFGKALLHFLGGCFAGQ